MIMIISLTQHLCGGLHDREWRALSVVDQHWDTAYVMSVISQGERSSNHAYR